MKRAILDARTAAWVRDGMQCNRCKYVTYSVQLHHRRVKGMGGDKGEHTDCPCNLITLCPPCHDHIHTVDRAGAEAGGFIVPRWCARPGEVGVARYGGPVAWLTCDGQWTREAA